MVCDGLWWFAVVCLIVIPCVCDKVSSRGLALRSISAMVICHYFRHNSSSPKEMNTIVRFQKYTLVETEKVEREGSSMLR